MRALLAAFVFASAFAACDTCPDGSTNGSLYCHTGTCATNESICAGVCANLQTDRDHCGTCDRACGDGLVCASGQCVEGCADGTSVNCGGLCTDVQTDEANCGACGATDPSHVCRTDQTCLDGTCACTATQVVCEGVCTDPQTSNTHCGATGDCTGTGAGTMCGATEGCVNGGCVSRLIYRGSLKATTGRWTYQGMLGLNGANAECAQRWPGSQICSYAKLMMASTRAVPETTNATDYDGAAVSAWWIDDPTAVANERCQSDQDAIPWSYGTADQGHVGKYVTLNRATGAISALVTGALPSCNTTRHVACCSTVVAP